MLYYYSQRNASADLGRVNVGRDGHEGHAWAGAEADGEAQNGSKSAIVAKATVNEDFMAVRLHGCHLIRGVRSAQEGCHQTHLTRV
jgi:hypothetical protein